MLHHKKRDGRVLKVWVLLSGRVFCQRSRARKSCVHHCLSRVAPEAIDNWSILWIILDLPGESSFPTEAGQYPLRKWLAEVVECPSRRRDCSHNQIAKEWRLLSIGWSHPCEAAWRGTLGWWKGFWRATCQRSRHQCRRAWWKWLEVSRSAVTWARVGGVRGDQGEGGEQGAEGCASMFSLLENEPGVFVIAKEATSNCWI